MLCSAFVIGDKKNYETVCGKNGKGKRRPCRKIKKAKAALEKRPFDMTDTGFELLKKQVEAMETYLDVLNQRIEYESGGEIRA